MASIPPSATPQFRERWRSGLKPYRTTENAERLFPANEARHDRIKLRVHVTVQLPSAMGLSQYAELVDNRTGHIVDDIMRISIQNDNTIKLVTKTSSWLFDLHGRLSFHSNTRNLTGILDLEINPTRFATHQLSPYNSTSAITLARSPQRRSELEALTLDCNDNMLSGLSHLGGTIFTNRSTQWQGLLERYLTATFELCRRTLAPQNSGVSAQIVPRNIAQAECYWELEVDYAALAVHELARQVQANDPQAEVRTVRSSNVNASWLTLALADGIRLAIYAKCSNRLRFEIRYLKYIPQELDRHSRPHSGSLLQRLMDLRICAASRMSIFWNDYRESIIEPTSQMQLVDFISRFNSSTPEGSTAALLALLAANRSVIASPQSSLVTPEVCRALKRAGILALTSHRNRGRVYRIAPAYRAVFNQIFGDDDVVAPGA